MATYFPQDFHVMPHTFWMENQIVSNHHVDSQLSLGQN